MKRVTFLTIFALIMLCVLVWVSGCSKESNPLSSDSLRVAHPALKPYQTTPCENCHAYPSTSVNLTTDITSKTVAPGGSFSVFASYTGGANDGTTKTQIAWPSGAENNSVFSFAPAYSSPSTSPTGSMTTTVTAPAGGGSYTIRVYATPGSWGGTSKETDYQNISVTVQAADNPPVANAGPDQAAYVGVTVNFDGSGSTDDHGITLYEWDFEADGTYDATGVTASHAYSLTGTYNVVLRVTDTASQTDTDTAVVTVTEPPAEVHDVGIRGLGVPKFAFAGSNTKDVTVVVYNYGSTTEVVNLVLTASGAANESRTLSGLTVAPGKGGERVKFYDWSLPNPGTVVWTAEVILATDTNPGNNTAVNTTIVKP